MANFISLEEAVQLTHAFQNSEIGNEQTFSGAFEKELIMKILDQENCEGLRIYNALNKENKITFVLVGYGKDMKDMTDGRLLDQAALCPPTCPPESPLM